MKTHNPVVSLFGAVLLILCCASMSAAKSAQEVFSFDTQNLDWVLPTGEEVEGTTWGGSMESNMWFCVVDPENNAAAKELEPSILVYSVQANQYTVVPFDAKLVAGVQNVHFSMDGQRMVVAVNMSRFFSQLMIYTLGPLQLENIIDMAYDELFFIDDIRFAFTLLEEKMERPEAAGLWAASAALYDPSYESGYMLLKPATATQSYAVMGINRFDQISVHETSVAESKDWEDVDKHKDGEILVEIPAAG